MKKVALFAGSFNPWHEGHQEIVDQALEIFDQVWVIQAQNSEKFTLTDLPELPNNPKVRFNSCVDELLAEYVNRLTQNNPTNQYAMIKGLRNTTDFEYEKSMQYNNEDLGLDIPVYYIIADRNLTHISSSAIRAIKKARG